MKRSRTLLRLCASTIALAAGAVALPNVAAAEAAPTCAGVTSDPRFELTNNPFIKSATSAIKTTAAPANTKYCGVTLVYGTNPSQNITIAVGLPLNPADGGTGGTVGAWNGRTEGLGGGGCAGNLNVDAAVNAGYVGSGTDGGHTGGDCTPGVNADHTYNFQFIQDFFRNGIKQQILWSKRIATAYYSKPPSYSYWNGCSTGGRQGYLLAQELGSQLDGILASAPAMYWTRFQTAQMWGQIAMLEQAGESPSGAIPPAKLVAAQKSAIAACDANDGITDGIIDDPRTCHFSAKANICGRPGAPAAPNCLTADEAAAVDKIWDGPRNKHGNRIWFGLDRGSDFSILDGPTPFALGVTQFEWNLIDPSFAPPSTKWTTVSLAGKGLSYPRVAEAGSRNIADVTDTFGPLDAFRARGGKLMTFLGANDQFIYPRGVLNYYRQMAERYQQNNDRTGFEGVRSFYRLYHAPGVGHCGLPIFSLGTAGPWPQNGDDFKALVNWVEKGVAPDQVVGRSLAPALSRPLCPYPQTAKYKGTGDVNDAASWSCGGNLETAEAVCPDVLVKYKDEVDGPLDYQASAVHPNFCKGRHFEPDDNSHR